MYHFKRGLTPYTNIISLSATITSSIPFQERRTYPLYQHHITVSYHHVQYSISKEDDLPTIPTSHHHQLPSHPIYHFKRGGLTHYTNVISLLATITSNIPFQERTYILYQHHITFSYHHIQYSISKEDLPTIPTSYHCQLLSCPIYHSKRGGLTFYTNIISPSATITSNIPFQERRTYPLYQHHITVSYHHIQYTISREDDLRTIPTSYHCQLPSHPIYYFKRGLTCYTNIISLSATITSNPIYHFKRE